MVCSNFRKGHASINHDGFHFFELHDLEFKILVSDTEKHSLATTVYVSRALVLFQTAYKETENSIGLPLKQVIELDHCPDFLKRVYHMKKSDSFILGSEFTNMFESNAHRAKDALKRLLQFLATEKFVDKLSVNEMSDVLKVSQFLNLSNTSSQIFMYHHTAHTKLS